MGLIIRYAKFVPKPNAFVAQPSSISSEYMSPENICLTKSITKTVNFPAAYEHTELWGANGR